MAPRRLSPYLPAALSLAATILAGGARSPSWGVLAICHWNRESNKKQNGGGLHGSRGSGDIEYEAWTVLDLRREMDDREYPQQIQGGTN